MLCWRQAHRSDTTHKSFYVCAYCVKQTAKQPAGASEEEDDFKGGSGVQRLREAIHLLTAEQAGTEVWRPYKVNILHWLALAGLITGRAPQKEHAEINRCCKNQAPMVLQAIQFVSWRKMLARLVPTGSNQSSIFWHGNKFSWIKLQTGWVLHCCLDVKDCAVTKN